MPSFDPKLDVVVSDTPTCLKCNYRDAVPGASYCVRCATPRDIPANDAPTAELAKRELAARELAKRRLLPFICRLKPDYKVGWFHQDLAARLERFARRCERRESPSMIINCPPRHGKPLSASFTDVFTTEGWKKHGELQPGDFVFSPSGKPVKVLANTGPIYTADYEVEFSNGEKLLAGPHHEWVVYDRASRKWRTVETEFFVENVTRGTTSGEPRRLRSGSRSTYQLPPVAPLQLRERRLSLDPYVLGAWLGDGSSGSPRLTHAPDETEIVAQIAACGYTPTSVTTHKTTGVKTTYFGRTVGFPDSTSLLSRLRKLDVLDNKHIPPQYMLGSIDQRLRLLAGLIDTDGSTNTTTGRVRFTTCSERLCRDVAELARTFGWRVGVLEAQPVLSTSGIQGRQITYVVAFQPDIPIPVRLERKRVTRFPVQRRIGIVAVRRVDNPTPANCITVDSEDGLYLAGRCLVPTHNSEQASKGLVAWYLGRNPADEIISATHSDKLAIDNSRDVLDYVNAPAYQSVFPGMQLKKDAKGATGWRTTEGGAYKPVGVGAGVAGYGANLLIIDDPHRDKDAYSETVRANILRWYKSSARTRFMPGAGQLIIQTRWVHDDLTGSLIEEEGLIEDGGKWELVCYPAQATHDEYRLGNGMVVHNYVEGAKLLRKEGEYLHPERYPPDEMEKHKADPVVWAALYQQQPSAGDAAMFKRESLRFCKLKDIPKGLTLYVTCDLALSQSARSDYTVFLVAGIDEDDTIWVVDLIREKWDSYDIVENLLDLYEERSPELIGVEKSHASIAIDPFLNKRMTERRLYGVPIEPMEHGNKDKILRARPIQARIRQGKVMFPEDAPWMPEFLKELDQFPVGKHDDQVDALAYLGQLLEDLMKVRNRSDRAEKAKKSWRDKLKQHRKGKKSWQTA